MLAEQEFADLDEAVKLALGHLLRVQLVYLAIVEKRDPENPHGLCRR
jgi:hypothetical protein